MKSPLMSAFAREGRSTPRGARALARAVFGAALLALVSIGASACTGAPRAPADPGTYSLRRGGITLVRARCASVESCLLGQVVAAETAAPLPRAAVFLEREAGEGDGPVRIVTVTDDQGVFAVEDAPSGRYRLAVYKEERQLEVRGLQLGAPGTTMVPVRLPPG
jgi:hypothetical protein